MAVEAHHLLHAGGQKLTTHAGWAGGGGICFEAPASTAQAASAPGRQAWYGREFAAGTVPSQQGYQQSCVGLVSPALAAAAGPMMMMGQYGQVTCAADASESGITSGGAHEVAAPRKRKRAENGQPPVLGVGAAGVVAHLQQELVDVDRLVLQHTEMMWAELTEQRRRHARQVVVAVEAAAAKRLRAKDEEIARVGRLNWALEERVKTLFVEAQVWRDLAQSNEAAANSLRGELQLALAAQASWGVVGAAGAGADDAESCCCGENDVAVAAGAGEEEVARTGRGRPCKVCGEGVAEVLLLPCRHLCACAPCAAATPACPACGGGQEWQRPRQLFVMVTKAIVLAE